jgi:hypothetical protein
VNERATAAALRAFALRLPQTEELDHLGSPSFRVAGKIFAQLADHERVALVKLSLDEQAERLESDPERFWTPVHWARFGWTYVRIADTDLAELHDLLLRSWKRIAPKSLAAAYVRAARDE